MALKTTEELRELFIEELQSRRPDLTDTNEGSLIDVMAGVCAAVTGEVCALVVSEFGKTFFDTANGPEVTGGPDDLERLAVDHFGDEFARPAASKATGTVTFSRATDDAGDVEIAAGTVVKTKANAAGSSQRFVTLSDVTLTGLSINASVEAVEAGVAGNVLAAKIEEIETSLTDSSVVVTNTGACSGGSDQMGDSAYREHIRNLIESLKGSSLPAIEAKARTVSGVAMATAIEKTIPVIEYDIATGDSIGSYFRVPRAIVYVADVNGTASASMVDAVKDAIDEIRSAGVKIDVEGASALSLNWTAEIALNPSGPNYAELAADPTKLLESMAAYVNNLAIGTDFDKSTADAAMLAIWGPSGTDDLTTFSTTIPSGDVSVAENEKLVAGTMAVT